MAVTASMDAARPVPLDVLAGVTRNGGMPASGRGRSGPPENDTTMPWRQPERFGVSFAGELSDGLEGYARTSERDGAIKEELARSTTPRPTAPHAILARHWKGRNSREEVMLELYHANISISAASAIARLLWGENTGVATVATGRDQAVGAIRTWLQREITEPQVYVYFQSITVKQKVRAETLVTRLIAVIGVNSIGMREGLAAVVVPSEETGWGALLAELKRRGLRGTKLFVGENEPTLAAAVMRYFPAAQYQGCLEELEAAALAKVPVSQVHFLMGAFAGLRELADESQARRQIGALGRRLREQHLVEAANLVEQCADFQFSYLGFPFGHHGRLRDIEPLQSILRDFREHIRLIGPLLESEVLVFMLATRMRYAARHMWSQRRYMQF